MRWTPQRGILRWGLDGLVLKVPAFGRAVRDLSLSRYCKAFAMLLKAGVPGVKAAEQSLGTVGNVLMANRLRGVAESVRQGNPFAEGLSRRLPLDFRESWQVGEETGALDDVAERTGAKMAESGEFYMEQFCRCLPRIVYLLVSIMLIKMILRGFASVSGSLGG